MPGGARRGTATRRSMSRGTFGRDRDHPWRPLSARGAAGPGWHGDHLPSARHATRTRGRDQAAPPRVPARSRLLVALPPGGAERRLAESPERRHGLRLRRGSVGAVHRHGVRRRRGPGHDPAPQRRPAAEPGRAHRGGRRPSARGQPRPRHRPSRRETRQRADRSGWAGQGRRLRDRASACRGSDDPAWHDARVGPLLQPGAGPRRIRDQRVRHLLAGHRPVRDAHRPAAVGG